MFPYYVSRLASRTLLYVHYGYDRRLSLGDTGKGGGVLLSDRGFDCHRENWIESDNLFLPGSPTITPNNRAHLDHCKLPFLNIFAHARAGQSPFSKGLLKIIKHRNYDELRARK
jgi:hypothetical protein